MAQAASVIVTIERILFSRLKSVVVVEVSESFVVFWIRNQNAGPAPFLP
jgi:hypothetical protein